MRIPRLKIRTAQIPFLVVITALMLIPAPTAAEVQTRYLYNLSTFEGPVHCTWARITLDENRNETYLVDQSEVRVFDANGMEIYRFGDDGSLGSISGVAVKENGEILVLSGGPSKRIILICNFRGQPLRRFSLTDAPEGFSGLTPDDIRVRNQRLYLVDSEALKVVVSDTEGRFLRGYDIGAMLEISASRRGANQLGGFSVDANGSMLFSIPVLFSVYRLSPDGELEIHKRPGSAPGNFNLVGGIVTDDRGYYYIADRLKNAVLVFDRDFQFLRQFGYRGPRPDNLFGPNYLALDKNNRLYVSQLQGRGVSVFNINYDDLDSGGR